MKFEAVLERLREIWGCEPLAESVEDFLTLHIRLKNGSVLRSRTHLFGDSLKLLPYDDLDSRVRDAEGNRYGRGDQELARAFRPGDIGFMLKHHRPEMNDHCGRLIETPIDEKQAKAQLKLQDSHVGVVLGVKDRDGEEGVVSVHNPQCYPFDKGGISDSRIEERYRAHFGRFGSSTYSMVFFKPEYPAYLTESIVRQFRDNIRTMVVGFNAVANYPSEGFDGSDPLAATDVQSTQEHAIQMVRAIAGNNDEASKARAWFSKPDYLLYCSEMIHVATSAGLHCPLNYHTFVPLVGKSVWKRFAEFVADHNEGKETPFTSLNKNHLVRHIELKIAGEDLQPVWRYAPEESCAIEGKKLAFSPLTMGEVIDLSLREIFDCAISDEAVNGNIEIGSLQGRDPWTLLGEVSPGFLSSLSDEIGTPDHGKIATPRIGRNILSELFVPPSLLHLVAKGKSNGGLLGLEYVGHGFHFSLVRPVKGACN